MANLNDLANRMASLRKAIPEAASKLAADTALAIVGSLAFRTPVDTSQAISNWQTTLDNAAPSNLGPHFPGVKGTTYRASAAETLANAKRVLGNKKPGQAIFIANNLPYIRKLNEGSSAQEPAGFVERAILIGRKQQTKFKIKAG